MWIYRKIKTVLITPYSHYVLITQKPNILCLAEWGVIFICCFAAATNMSLTSNAPTLKYWLGSPERHELKSQLGVKIHCFESPDQHLVVFFLLLRDQFMSVGAVLVFRYQFPDATSASHSYFKKLIEFPFHAERELKKCSISRSIIHSPINTGIHNSLMQLWPGVISHSQRHSNIASCVAHSVFDWMESLVTLAAGGFQKLN